MKYIDLTGQKFNMLYVNKYIETDKFGNAKWECFCDCGTTKIISTHNLKKGIAKSCGCLHKKIFLSMTKLKFTTHGFNRTSTYNIWSNIIQRCNNPKSQAYKNYGGRGIKVCKRWSDKNGFINFLTDMGERPKGCEINRINNNGDYCKENCNWVSSKENCRNKRNTRFLKYNKKKLCYAEWEEITGIPQQIIGVRIRRGWSVERTLTTPLKKIKKKSL